MHVYDDDDATAELRKVNQIYSEAPGKTIEIKDNQTNDVKTDVRILYDHPKDQMLKRNIKYLKGTIDLGLWYPEDITFDYLSSLMPIFLAALLNKKYKWYFLFFRKLSSDLDQ